MYACVCSMLKTWVNLITPCLHSKQSNALQKQIKYNYNNETRSTGF